MSLTLLATQTARYLRQHVAFVTLCAVSALLIALLWLLPPALLGSDWRGVQPNYTDSVMYKAPVASIGKGNLTDGNPYFIEHRNDPPLVLFGGDYINALPLFLGLTLDQALLLNMVVFSFLFLLTFFYLFRILGVSPWLSAFGTFLAYLQFFSHIERPSNMQPFLPLVALFYVFLFSFLREPTRKGVVLLGLTTGAMFYLYSYLWQTFVITLGLVLGYALITKQKKLFIYTFWSGILSGCVGIWSLLYILWLSRHSPYFWESLGRFGLVETHIPMAEVFYSGSWVGFILVFILFLWIFAHILRTDERFKSVALLLVISGLGLWIMQGSNLITGKLLETAEHIKYFIFAWLLLATFSLTALLWKRRREYSLLVRLVSVVVLGAGMGVSLYYSYLNYYPVFIGGPQTVEVLNAWRDQQAYKAPLDWIATQEPGPVVLWEDPHDLMTWNTYTLSGEYVLFATPGMWHLLSDGELTERYLVAEYFKNPTEDDLKADIATYMGRQRAFHQAKTIEREVKVCRLLHFYDRGARCSAIPSSIDTIGESTFAGLEQKFTNDIKPHIKDYLKKYHVSYIVKDLKLHPEYTPETLGAARVYTDGRYELWKLP